jgi:hypothetical protein
VNILAFVNEPPLGAALQINAYKNFGLFSLLLLLSLGYLRLLGLVKELRPLFVRRKLFVGG